MTNRPADCPPSIYWSIHTIKLILILLRILGSSTSKMEVIYSSIRSKYNALNPAASWTCLQVSAEDLSTYKEVKSRHVSPMGLRFPHKANRSFSKTYYIRSHLGGALLEPRGFVRETYSVFISMAKSCWSKSNVRCSCDWWVWRLAHIGWRFELSFCIVVSTFYLVLGRRNDMAYRIKHFFWYL